MADKRVDAENGRAEKVIPKGRLQQLVKRVKAAQSRIATERGELAPIITKAVETEHLNKTAFQMALRLEAMNDPAKQSRVIRSFMLYVDHLGLGGQADIEDAISDAEDEDEEEESEDQVVDDVLDAASGKDGFDAGAPETELTLRKFREAIAEDGIGESQVRRALGNFVADHPALAGEAEEVAAERISKLAAVASKPRRRAKPKAEPTQEFGSAVH